MLSAKAQYACLAMLQLAMDYEAAEPTPLRAIAEQHCIPATFLVQILNELKRGGLVTSTRGAAGGYRLSRPPHELTLADVVALSEATEVPDQCAAADSPLAGTMVALCQELAEARRDCLQRASLSEIAAQAQATSRSGPMWYI
jgi:Rrf2 family protein